MNLCVFLQNKPNIWKVFLSHHQAWKYSGEMLYRHTVGEIKYAGSDNTHFKAYLMRSYLHIFICRISLRWFRELPTLTWGDSCWKPAIYYLSFSLSLNPYRDIFFLPSHVPSHPHSCPVFPSLGYVRGATAPSLPSVISSIRSKETWGSSCLHMSQPGLEPFQNYFSI